MCSRARGCRPDDSAAEPVAGLRLRGVLRGDCRSGCQIREPARRGRIAGALSSPASFIQTCFLSIINPQEWSSFIVTRVAELRLLVWRSWLLREDASARPGRT